MYKVDIAKKTLVRLTPTKYSSLKLKESYDIEEWIEKNPEILGEELLIINRQYCPATGLKLDLLAVDKDANLVIIELKRDDTGTDVEWQSIKYTSYCSILENSEIFKLFAEYSGNDEDKAQFIIEDFIDKELDELNENQRIIIVSNEFHPHIITAVDWLRNYELDITCIRLKPYVDQSDQLFVNPEIIIPVPEIKDYITKKEKKQKVAKKSVRSSFSLEKSNLPNDKLKEKLLNTLRRDSELTFRLIAFLKIISSDEKTVYDREYVKSKLFEKGIGNDVGHAGRYLSNISQFLTKKATPHLRQIINFDTGGTHGETKDNYYVLPEYKELLKEVIHVVDIDNTI